MTSHFNAIKYGMLFLLVANVAPARAGILSKTATLSALVFACDVYKTRDRNKLHKVVNKITSRPHLYRAFDRFMDLRTPKEVLKWGVNYLHENKIIDKRQLPCLK